MVRVGRRTSHVQVFGREQSGARNGHQGSGARQRRGLLRPVRGRHGRRRSRPHRLHPGPARHAPRQLLAHGGVSAILRGPPAGVLARLGRRAAGA
eukprot:7066344-Pyramimonas_sp.AAC.1